MLYEQSLRFGQTWFRAQAAVIPAWDGLSSSSYVSVGFIVRFHPKSGGSEPEKWGINVPFSLFSRTNVQGKRILGGHMTSVFLICSDPMK